MPVGEVWTGDNSVKTPAERILFGGLANVDYGGSTCFVKAERFLSLLPTTLSLGCRHAYRRASCVCVCACVCVCTCRPVLPSAL